MFKAVEYGKLTSVEYIIEVEDADKEVSNNYGETHFYAAFLNGKIEIVQY